MAGGPALAAGETADTTINSWFRSDAEGWTLAGDAGTRAYMETGGHPGGHVCADDKVAGTVWYFEVPAKFLGDRSAAYGGGLQFVLKQSSTSDQFQNHDVVLGDGSRAVVDDVGNATEHPGADWTPYSIPLDAAAAGWTWASGEPVTEGGFREVLANLTALWIRGEYVSGSDRGCLDNLQLPASDAGDVVDAGTYYVGQVLETSGYSPGDEVELRSADGPLLTDVSVGDDGTVTVDTGGHGGRLPAAQSDRAHRRVRGDCPGVRRLDRTRGGGKRERRKHSGDHRQLEPRRLHPRPDVPDARRR